MESGRNMYRSRTIRSPDYRVREEYKGGKRKQQSEFVIKMKAAQRELIQGESIPLESQDEIISERKSHLKIAENTRKSQESPPHLTIQPKF